MHWHGLAILNDDGRRAAVDPVADPAGRQLHLRVHRSRRRHLLCTHMSAHSWTAASTAPLIIEDPNEKADYDDELVLVLDDWIDGTGTTPGPGAGESAEDRDEADEPRPGRGDQPDDPARRRRRRRHLPLLPDQRARPHGSAGMWITVRDNAFGCASSTPARTRAFRVGVPGTDLNVTHTDGYPVMPRRRRVGDPRHGRARRRHRHRRRVGAPGRGAPRARTATPS